VQARPATRHSRSCALRQAVDPRVFRPIRRMAVGDACRSAEPAITAKPALRARRVVYGRASVARPAWWNGRHQGLKIPCLRACRFESGRGHHAVMAALESGHSRAGRRMLTRRRGLSGQPWKATACQSAALVVTSPCPCMGRRRRMSRLSIKHQRTINMAPNPTRKKYRELNEKITALKADIEAKREDLKVMRAERDALKLELDAQKEPAS
jgi:hypothetical protein